jgi:hypothetical protein
VTSRLIASWLLLNLLPFSAFGMALVAAGIYFDRRNTYVSRLVFGLLVAGLIVTTCVTTGYAAVIYDYCSDPNIPAWLWWLNCALR